MEPRSLTAEIDDGAAGDWDETGAVNVPSTVTTTCSTVPSNSTKIRKLIVATISTFITRNLQILNEESKERKKVM
jgi:hypothetical protein